MSEETSDKQGSFSTESQNASCKENHRPKGHGHNHGASGAVYGLGFIGALVYYISAATSFWMGVLGFLKALVWPAFMVFELMKYLQM